MGNPCGIAPHKQKGAEIDRALMAYPLMGFKRFEGPLPLETRA
jgi:hypothetical protein